MRGAGRRPASLPWADVRAGRDASHAAPCRPLGTFAARRRRQRGAHRDRCDRVARPAGGRGRDAPRHAALPVGPRVRRHPAHPGRRPEARDDELADAPVLPRRRGVRPPRPAARCAAHARGAGRGRVDRLPLRHGRRAAGARPDARAGRGAAQGELRRVARGHVDPRPDPAHVPARPRGAGCRAAACGSRWSPGRSSPGSPLRSRSCPPSTTCRTRSPRRRASTTASRFQRTSAA